MSGAMYGTTYFQINLRTRVCGFFCWTLVNQTSILFFFYSTRWMINNLHIGRIYVFEASQFLNHFLKNGIFACRHCLYKTALPNISHIYSLLKWNALKNDAFVPWNVFSFLFGVRGVKFYWTLKTSHNILINLVVKTNNQYNIWRYIVSQVFGLCITNSRK